MSAPTTPTPPRLSRVSSSNVVIDVARDVCVSTTILRRRRAGVNEHVCVYVLCVSPAQCAFYFINFFLDCTVGVFVVFMLLRAVERWAALRGWEEVLVLVAREGRGSDLSFGSTKTTSSEKEMASVAAPSDRSQRCQKRREASGTVPESKRSLLSETVPLDSQLFDTTNNGPTARRHSPWHSFSDDAVFRASSLSPRESEGAARERRMCDVRRGGVPRRNERDARRKARRVV